MLNIYHYIILNSKLKLPKEEKICMEYFGLQGLLCMNKMFIHLEPNLMTSFMVIGVTMFHGAPFKERYISKGKVG